MRATGTSIGRLAVAAAFAAASVGAPVPPAAAQDSGLGVVTSLTGSATVVRAAGSGPLHFKDSVQGHDRISTAEQSIVRVLLGGRAVVTMRELSELTIAGGSGGLGLELASGTVGLAMARQLMGTGESLDVRTPNALGSLQGAVAVVDVHSAAAGPARVSVFSILSGPAEIGSGGVTVRLASRQRVRIVGDAIGPIEDLTDGEIGRLAVTLKGGDPQHSDAPPGFKEEMTAREQDRALTYAPGPIDDLIRFTGEPAGAPAVERGAVPGPAASGCTARAIAATGVVTTACAHRESLPAARPADTRPADAVTTPPRTAPTGVER